MDLNGLYVEHDGTARVLGDPGAGSDTVRAYFRDLEAHLLVHLGPADVVVGCVAWLSNPSILAALARRQGVSIIVQPEPYLHDRGAGETGIPQTWRSLYDVLPTLGYPDTLRWGEPLPTSSAPRPFAAVRQLETGAASRALLHHKFLVFCRQEERASDNYSASCQLAPYAVWTGSFNLTPNATQSLENALYVEDGTIALAYFGEWAQLALLSTPLDGSTDTLLEDHVRHSGPGLFKQGALHGAALPEMAATWLRYWRQGPATMGEMRLAALRRETEAARAALVAHAHLLPMDDRPQGKMPSAREWDGLAF